VNYSQDALIHSVEFFKRKNLTGRLKKVGFNSLPKIELFLWDLEIFLQFQEVLKKKIVLKGGSAVQFYIPIEYQRASVDVDAVCNASQREIETAIAKIEDKFNGDGDLFTFKLYQPEQPKTDLPLFTYFVNIPSICTDRELFGSHSGFQELKIEFHVSEGNLPIAYKKSPSIFALNTDKTYQIFPLNILIGDKLSCLGPNTIGIPSFRSDEQIKQIYDIWALFEFKLKEVEFNKIEEYLLKRAKLECKARDINFNINEIKKDMIEQLEKLSLIDLKEDEKLIKLINDFQSLYLRKSINKPVSEWAIMGKKLIIILKSVFEKSKDKAKLEEICSIDDRLKFGDLKGQYRGNLIIKFKEKFLEKFVHYSPVPGKIIKGKSQRRIFWEIITVRNATEVCGWTEEFLRKNIS